MDGNRSQHEIECRERRSSYTRPEQLVGGGMSALLSQLQKLEPRHQIAECEMGHMQ